MVETFVFKPLTVSLQPLMEAIMRGWYWSDYQKVQIAQLVGIKLFRTMDSATRNCLDGIFACIEQAVFHVFGTY